MAKHLFPINTSHAEPFKPKSGGSETKTPERDRAVHGRFLLDTITGLTRQIEDLPPRPNSDSVYLEFQSAPDSKLALKSIDSPRDGRELVAVRTDVEGGQEIVTATVLVNPKKLSKLSDKLEVYLTEDKPKKANQPKNKELVDSISTIRFAALKSILVGTQRVEDANRVESWEAWLRVGNSDEERADNLALLRRIAHQNNLTVGEKVISFPERSVALIRASFTEINELIFPSNILAELRYAAVTAEFFLGLDRREQIEWINDAANRVTLNQGDIPAVCVLDTGVNNEHPLIRLGLFRTDMHSYDPQWLVTDHNSHGTGMAGLCLYGDLVEILEDPNEVNLRHRLESVKILPPNGQNPHELYGSITKECVARVEIAAPNRKRVICMAVASVTDRNRGMPSSWSAAIDGLACGKDEDDPSRRLFFVAAGNANPLSDQAVFELYPASNHVDDVHDPGQSWNALTVGSFTEKVTIPADSPEAGSQVLAPSGLLSPHSTTSMVWNDSWPIKPDIVLEGGNLANSGGAFIEQESLRLLTTNWQWQTNPLRSFGATSASTALASRLGGIILAEYPDIWPETLRGLLVHSANWTDEMRAEIGNDRRQLLRCYGYGVPNLNRALESARNSLTLIVQDQLQPFKKDGYEIKANEMNLHQLPWARDILLQLGAVQAEMRVTLSYFIEPNPSSTGFSLKHRYASHQLRFATIKENESRDDFRKRVNLASRLDGEPPPDSDGDSAGWFLKEKLRSKGSIHSDVWNGNAADLAMKNTIAVYPVGGWWKDLKRQQKWDSIARYSLIVSIRTESEEVDIYSIIQNQIENVIEIEN
jgi:Subtilase family